MRLSVVICTRNRSAWVRLAVASAVNQDMAADEYEVIVVDNGSTDATPKVLEALADAHDNMRWVSEPEAGLSRARNRGITEARGDVIAFLDDDAEACSSWARLHIQTYEDDAVSATGGRILLAWPGPRPRWLPPDPTAESMYSGLDLGPQPQEFVLPMSPFGANMAVRRSAFERVGAFSPELGRQGSSLVSYEELDLFERVKAVGGRMVYVPDASVVHHVLPDRVSRRWFLRRFYAQGRSKVLMDELRGPRNRAYWFGRAGWHVARSARFSGALLAQAAQGHRDDVTREAAHVAQAAGTAAESLRVAVRQRRSPQLASP